MDILDELDARGLIADTTDRDGLRALLAAPPTSFYCGFDPTGTSLHLGSLVPITLITRMQRAGHRPHVLVGGATGMIGDPSGKSSERSLLDPATLSANLDAIRAQLGRFLDFSPGPNSAVMVNNADWFASISFLDFLRDVGKHLTLNYMIAKESVRSRLEDREQGISYTEFSYMLLQAYDFVHLAAAYDCRLQLGATDQWGNITAGIELQRKLGRPGLHGLVCPLLLDSQGRKMGKSATGQTIWLDANRTSPYAMYQYLLNVDDSDVDRLLRIFSWRELGELDEISRRHERSPQDRTGQKTLAEDVVRFVHGEENLERARRASRVMFGGTLAGLRDEDLAPLLADVPASEVARERLSAGIALVDLLTETGLADSKGAARRLLSGGGVYVNNVRVTEAGTLIGVEQLATESMLVLRTGKKCYHVVRVA